jgi:dihydrofolate reductase
MIAAVGNCFEIGYRNQLLVHLPADLKHFKNITAGHTVIMGDRTWESLPKKPLPNRRNIVLTLDKNYQADGAELAFSVDEVFHLLTPCEIAFVIGGATVYRLFIKKIDKLYLTRIMADFQADAFFPMINFQEWKLLNDELYKADEANKYDMHFQVYKKI